MRNVPLFLYITYIYNIASCFLNHPLCFKVYRKNNGFSSYSAQDFSSPRFRGFKLLFEFLIGRVGVCCWLKGDVPCGTTWPLKRNDKPPTVIPSRHTLKVTEKSCRKILRKLEGSREMVSENVDLFLIFYSFCIKILSPSKWPHAENHYKS